MGTLEAIQAIRRRWQLGPNLVAVGGLKDKLAWTTQHLTVDRGPRRSLAQTSFSLEYLGQADRPFASADIIGNRFEIVLRRIESHQIHVLQAAWPGILHRGLPNYFDDQRFGSRGESGEFIAAPWCKGDWQRVLWLVLAEPNSRDRPRDRTDKQFLSALGDWRSQSRGR